MKYVSSMEGDIITAQFLEIFSIGITCLVGWKLQRKTIIRKLYHKSIYIYKQFSRLYLSRKSCDMSDKKIICKLYNL